MRLFVDDTYLREREQFRLVATCQECVHYAPRAGECSLTYPTAPHDQALHDGMKDGDVLMFCKTFEAG